MRKLVAIPLVIASLAAHPAAADPFWGAIGGAIIGGIIDGDRGAVDGAWVGGTIGAVHSSVLGTGVLSAQVMAGLLVFFVWC